MNKPVLVVMAAGMGSRYGCLFYTSYTRAIESKGADGSDSASAFCVFAGYCSGGIEGLLNKAPAHIRCGERITNRGGIITVSYTHLDVYKRQTMR